MGGRGTVHRWIRYGSWLDQEGGKGEGGELTTFIALTLPI